MLSRERVSERVVVKIDEEEFMYYTYHCFNRAHQSAAVVFHNKLFFATPYSTFASMLVGASTC